MDITDTIHICLWVVVYLALVRPHLEYASSTWDPHLQKHIQQIEMVQRRAARFIKRPWYSDNITRTTGITTTFNKEKNSLYHTFT